MRIVITGGKGFIGAHLAEQLEANGEEPILIDSKPVQNCPDDVFGDADVIYHLAAIPRLGLSLDQPEKVLQNNHDATLRVLEFCRRHPRTRLINVSSSSVKFANLRENPYALSKKIGEDLVNLYIDTFGVKAVNVRLFNVYGPGESDYGRHTTLVKACKKRLMGGESLKVNGDGSMRRDYTHVLDVVNGLLSVDRALVNADALRLYELGAASPTSVQQIVEEFQRGTNLKIEYGDPRPGDPLYTCADPNLRPKGWMPVFDVLDYIQDWKTMGCPND